ICTLDRAPPNPFWLVTGHGSVYRGEPEPGSSPPAGSPWTCTRSRTVVRMPRARVLVLVAVVLTVLGCAAAVVRASDDPARLATATTTTSTTSTTTTSTSTTTTTTAP